MDEQSCGTSASTKDRLRDAALALFARKGYDATSTREICAAAHCNIAMISHYYGSKEGLLLSIVTDFMTLEGNELRRLASSSLPADVQLARFIDFLVDGIARRPRAMLIMHRELRERSTDASSSLRNQMDDNIRMMSDLLEKSGISHATNLPPYQLAHMLIGMLVFYFDYGGDGSQVPSDDEIFALKSFIRSRFQSAPSVRSGDTDLSPVCKSQDGGY